MDEEEEERLVFTRDEIHSCRLLVIIQNDKVQLLHKSTKDFLTGSNSKHFINEFAANAMLAYCCVDRLLQHSHMNIREQKKKGILNDGFLQYSVEFWPQHAHLAKTKFAVIPQQVEFFKPSSKHREEWLGLLNSLVTLPRIPKGYSILHVAARWGILELIHNTIAPRGQKRLADGEIKVYRDSDYQDNDFLNGKGITPLQEAATHGHVDVFSALLERSNKNTVIKETIITAAVQNSSSGKDLVRLLLEQRGDQIQITEEVVQAAADGE